MPDTRVTVCQVLLTLGVGGAEVLAARIARRLAGRFRFVFLCLNEPGILGPGLHADGFAVHSLRKRSGIDWRAVGRLATTLRRERVDVVHAHQYAPFFYACLGRLFTRHYPLLMTEHGRNHPDLPSRRHFVANRLLLRRGDRLVAVGEAVRRALIANEGFPAERVEVVFNGVDLSAFADADRDREQVRRELGLQNSDFVLVQVARLNALKDHLTAVRTLERVVRMRRDARLVIIGDGEKTGEIVEAIRGRGLESFVRFLGLRNDIPRLVGAADVSLLTSISEGIPLTLIEAMGAGLPVVATRVGGVPEVVQEGRTGLLSPAGDDAGLAEQILHLASDPILREKLGRAGRALAHVAFTEDRMVAEYDRIYRELAAASGRSLPALVASE